MKKIILMIFGGLSLVSVFQTRAQDISGMISQQVANQISRTVSDAVSKQLADRLLFPTLKIKNESGDVRKMHLSSDAKLFVVEHDDGSIRVWDWIHGVQRPAIRFADDVNALAAISSRKLIAIGSDDGVIELVDVFSGRIQYHLALDYGDITALALNSDETQLAAAYTSGKIVIWELKIHQKIKELDTRHGNDIQHLSFINSDQDILLAGEGGFVERRRLNDNQVLSGVYDDIEDVNHLWVKAENDEVIFADTDNLLRTLALPPQSFAQTYTKKAQAMAMNIDLSLLAMALDNKLLLWNRAGQTLAKEIRLKHDLKHLFFLDQGEKLLGIDDKGILYLINLASGTEVLQLISTESGWTIVDEAGRFDSSEPGMNNVAWEAEDFEIPIDRFATSPYEPGLLATHTEPSPEFINEQPLKVPAGIKLPPEISLKIEDPQKTAGQPVRIQVDVQGLGGGVNQVNLYMSRLKQKLIVEKNSSRN